jgi:RND superfamily putative drug exporter
MRRLAAIAYHRRGRVLVAWALLLAVAVAAAAAARGDYFEDYSTPGSESRAVQERLATAFPDRSAETIDVVWTAPGGAANRQDEIAGLLERAGERPGIGAATAPRFSPDGRVGVAQLAIDATHAAAVPAESVRALLADARAGSRDGLEVHLGGFAVQNVEQAEGGSETAGLLVAAVVLLVTFGSVVAAGLPLLTALFGLGVTVALIGLLTRVLDTPDWSLQVATMMGLGVGIDYALLILTRHRAALARGASTQEAIAEALATAGRSVLIAGTTVVISVLGLFLMGLTYLYGVAVSASLAVLVTMAASVTLLPAALAFLGPRVNRLRVPGTRGGTAGPSEGSAAARWGRLVQRRPWVAAAAGLGLLLALAAPVTGMRIGFPDAGNERAGSSARAAHDLLTAGFGPGAAGPLVLVGSGDADAVAGAVRATPGVAAVSEPERAADGRMSLLTVTPASAPQAAATEDLVRRLREDVLPRAGADVDVGGATAAAIDQSQATAERLPLFIGAVVALSFLLLLVAFRAPVVAAKAGVLNLLSIAAAYGVVALVADGGWAGELVGIDTETPVPPFIPVLMFAILFGLSMDYEVFLLARVREELARHGDPARAVTDGLARTARVITAAAAIMVVVFGAFAFSPEVVLKLIGVGLATAILVDATVVRMLLVPAVMQLLGRASWWLPRWLDRALPRLDLEAPAPAPA